MLSKLGSWQGVLIATMLMVIAVAFLGAYWKGEDDRKALAASIAVSMLPNGVEEDWQRYVAHRLSTSIRPHGSQIHISERSLVSGIFDDQTVVSKNMPYSVYCNDILGGVVSFGNGDTAVDVFIFGPLATDDEAPDLVVHEDSIAAKSLRKSLCIAIQRYMAILTN